MVTTGKINIHSVGQTAQRLSLPVASVHKLADQLGVSPAASINRVPYFDEIDVERMESHVMQQRTRNEDKR